MCYTVFNDFYLLTSPILYKLRQRTTRCSLSSVIFHSIHQNIYFNIYFIQSSTGYIRIWYVFMYHWQTILICSLTFRVSQHNIWGNHTQFLLDKKENSKDLREPTLDMKLIVFNDLPRQFPFMVFSENQKLWVLNMSQLITFTYIIQINPQQRLTKSHIYHLILIFLSNNLKLASGFDITVSGLVSQFGYFGAWYQHILICDMMPSKSLDS